MVLVVPIKNINEEIQGVQFISKEGEKRIYGLKKENFHLIGDLKDDSRIFISEGYATAASIYEASGLPVIVAFDCGNLNPIVEEIRKKYPRNPIFIAADNDSETPENPGKTKAKEAAINHACKMVIPKFPADFRLPNGKFPTDFNDLHVHFDLDHVKEQLKEIQEVKEEWDPPSPLPEGLPPVASLEADMIPEPLRDWLMDIAENIHVAEPPKPAKERKTDQPKFFLFFARLMKVLKVIQSKDNFLQKLCEIRYFAYLQNFQSIFWRFWRFCIPSRYCLDKKTDKSSEYF